ncbi:uncharacterized protein BJ171DRAFT_533808 [Polychytrium aggregatum]|uniref:uncharacterized protein n=1 Tax=Polychytrium aggregatum TaxID=110093 RepID=UPI0022FEBEAF|nr:uncharacterized protein BJ171DRAFT_533808 [Polychytrium aggregatum]KAI9193117.1 hypothetical protein BJ171DRAFT_533808 [Polychytrium aggregatum]
MQIPRKAMHPNRRAAPSSGARAAARKAVAARLSPALVLVVVLALALGVDAQWRAGQATHYGPFPDYLPLSEAGYQANDVGVGCSNGQPGGDPHWNAILSKGVYPPLNNSINIGTVWPKTATVAVSEAMYGFANKDKVCWSTLTIRNAANHSQTVQAIVVDFCPANGCLWPADQLANNVDLYGEATWNALGGGLLDGTVNIEIIWPANLNPNAQPMSGWAIFGIVAGVLVALGIVGFVVYRLRWRHRRHRPSHVILPLKVTAPGK